MQVSRYGPHASTGSAGLGGFAGVRDVAELMALGSSRFCLKILSERIIVLNLLSAGSCFFGQGFALAQLGCLRRPGFGWAKPGSTRRVGEWFL